MPLVGTQNGALGPSLLLQTSKDEPPAWVCWAPALVVVALGEAFMVVAAPLMVVATGVTVDAAPSGLTVIHGSRAELSIQGNDVSMCANWRNRYKVIP